MEDINLYLSQDKEQLLDKDGNVVAVKKENNGRVFYQEPGFDAQGNGKVCVGWKSKKVCVNWNDKQICIGWDTVEYCVKWEYES